MKTNRSIEDLNRQLTEGNDSVAWELDQQFRDRLCDLVDQQMNEIYKRRQDPEDIVQSVMRSFYVRAANGEFHFEDRNDLWSLLNKIARNKMLKRIEKDRAGKRDVTRERNMPTDVENPLKPTEAAAHVLAEALDRAIKGMGRPAAEIFRLNLYGYTIAEIVEIVLRDLDPPYPQMLQMRLEGASEQEIANKLGCLHGKVRYKLRRIQDRLGGLLGDDLE